MVEQVDAPEGGCDPMGSPRWSRLLAGPVDPWREEPTLEQFGPEGLHLVLEQFVRNCTPWEGPMMEEFKEDCLVWEGLHAGAGEECEESSP
ncbi:EH domain-containing protein 4 [Grus japonensis]|uniref:EH domain-containing protein 4 n=1 Tax=Grus japonensis TaxID=30415 RepID=A0ABC9WSP1_GRUJA